MLLPEGQKKDFRFHVLGSSFGYLPWTPGKAAVDSSIEKRKARRQGNTGMVLASMGV